jgi:predicted Zn-dependent protease
MHGLTLTVISFVRQGGGVSAGSVTGSVTTPEQARALVAAADSAARSAGAAEDAAELVSGDASPAWSEPPAQTGIDVFADFAPHLGEAFGVATAADRVLYGFVDHRVQTTYLGSTTGLRLRHAQPTGHYACTGKPGDLSRSAWVGGATLDFTDVDPLAMEQSLARRLAWGSRQIELPAGRYDTILPPSSVADLMIDAYWYAGARTAADGQSVYSRPGGGTRLGEALTKAGVSLFSDPAYPGLECAGFNTASTSDNEQSVFDNGLPLGRTPWIENGVLRSLIQTRQSADLTGQPVTPYVDNLILDAGGSGSLDDLVRGTERGLLLTCLWYIREVDPQTLLLTAAGRSRPGCGRRTPVDAAHRRPVLVGRIRPPPGRPPARGCTGASHSPTSGLGGVRGVAQRDCRRPARVPAADLVDLAADRDHRVAEPVDLGPGLALGRLDHQRAGDRERHRRRVETVVDEPLGDVVDGDPVSLVMRAGRGCTRGRPGRRSRRCRAPGSAHERRRAM